MRSQSAFGPVAMALALLVLVTVSGGDIPAAELAQFQQGKGKVDFAVDTGEYEVVPNWPQPLPDGPDGVKHAGYTWGSGGGGFAESSNRVWIAQRGERPLPPGAKPWTTGTLLIPPRDDSGRDDYGGVRGWERRWHHNVFAVDRDGKTVVEWPHLDKFFSPPNTLARGPHKIKMSPYDKQKHVWIIDDDLHEIHKFSYDGKLVKTFGERGVPGRGPNNFNRPTDIAWLPDGTFFIADGYAGTRVAKFDPNGKFLMDWGEVPKDPAKPVANEFYSVHSIDISRNRRIYVNDREHSRIQVFDENGKFLFMWTVGYKAEVYTHMVTEDDFVWAADHTTSRLIKFDLDGRYLYDVGGPGPLPGQFRGVHQISVDQDRNLYLTEVWNGRTQKWRPKPKADPGKIVGPPVGGWPPQ